MHGLTVDIRFVDEFKEGDHPRGHGEHGGEFVAKGTGGASSSAKSAPSGKKTAPLPRGSASAHLQPAPTDRAQHPAHIKALKLPPAWTNVHISHDPNSPLQAIGQDAKGRKQYVYHPKFSQSQAEAKFGRIKELNAKFDKIKALNAKNQQSKDPAVRAHADATALIMGMGVRPGSDEDTKAETKAYGATTLEGKHVSTKGGQTRLKFTGKKGVPLDLQVHDPQLSKMLADRAKQAGPSGQLFPNVSASSLLNYTHGFGQFKTKDFRTLLGTRSAHELVSTLPAPKNEAQYKKAVRHVATEVSNKLGNTPTVALQSYINPSVFAEWRASAGV